MGFVFVDRILELDPGVTIRAEKYVREDEEIFEVHYPGFPVVPGSFLIEMMAQTAGRCLDAERRPRGLAMLARIQSAGFHSYVGPCQTADIGGTIKTNREAFATAESVIHVDGALVAKAELFFTFVPYDQLAPGFRDAVLEAYGSGKDLSGGTP